MTLVNVWARDLSKCHGRMVATVEHRQHVMLPVRDLTFAVVREARTVDAVRIYASDPPDLLTADILHGILTIEDEPDFAYVVDRVSWMRDKGIDALAVPLIAHMRHSTLPDWYVPDARFCK